MSTVIDPAQSADLLDAKLKALGVMPCLDPIEARFFRPGVLEKTSPHREQMHVPGLDEPIDELTEEMIDALAEAIAERTKEPTFYQLILPEGVEDARRFETRSVSCRYIRYYAIAWDKYGVRLDVLFDREAA